MSSLAATEFFLQSELRTMRYLLPIASFNPLTPSGATWVLLKHPVSDQIKQSTVIFDIRALWRSGLSVKVPGCQKLQITA